MKNNHFDYIIIGNGMAGLQLAYAIANDAFFDSKSIALIDKEVKNTNDKTWSFWEKGHGQWEKIIYKSWSKAFFNTSKKQLSLNLKDYNYKSVRAIDFYNYISTALLKKSNFKFIIDNIDRIEESDTPTVIGMSQTYVANHVFDSRIPKAYFEEKDTYIKIHQHFKGWIIETDYDAFNPEAFTMMDYRIKYQNDTTFTYVLPFTKRKALVEFTFFTPYTVQASLYDDFLKKYIKNILTINDYKLTEIETGDIPMTNFPFNKYHSKNLTKIGTAAGWVKGSTGYAFKNTEKKVAQIIGNLKQKKLPSTGLSNKKYLLYDKIFLDVLKNNNEKGEWIFSQFYTKNSVETMFRFLDEESSFFEDISIMSSLFSSSFIHSFFRTLR